MKENAHNLILEKNLAFGEILATVHKILHEAEYNAQAYFVGKLLDAIKSKDSALFIKLINSIDMWGGSGAVWEVYIEDQDKTNEFERAMINLIDLMEETSILGNGIRPIRTIFLKNLRT